MQNNPEKMCFIIAGGGTGGHLFPGIAVAEEIRLRMPQAVTLFVVGRRKMESDILARHGQPTRSIDVEGIKGRGLLRTISSVLRLPHSVLQSYHILREWRPAVVVGMGGYSAGPVCLAAKWMGIPTAIHEQNSFPGLTNRWLSNIVDMVFISFGQSRRFLKGKRIEWTGNPVRKDILAMRGKQPGVETPFTLLVVGGSQGAKAVNKTFVSALEILERRDRMPRVIHQTGKGDFDNIQSAYAARGLEGQVVPFIDNMAEAYAQAHLVVGRAGATTVFELAALGKPSILVPYPFAANNHQESNALSLAEAGGAIMIRQPDLTASGLADTLAGLMDDPRRLEEMGRSAAGLGRPDAAERIVDLILQRAGKSTGRNTVP